MATDQVPRAVGASGTESEAAQRGDRAERTPMDLTPVQVVAGSLAAVSAAVASSASGLAGTLIGAALAGVVVTVTNALYIHSFNRTSEKIRTLPGRRYVRRGVSLPHRAPLAVAAPDGSDASDVEHVADRQLAGVGAVRATVAAPAARVCAAGESGSAVTDQWVGVPATAGDGPAALGVGLRIRPGAPAWVVPVSSAAMVIVVTVVAVAIFELSTGRTLASLFESGRKGAPVTAMVPGGNPYQASLGGSRTPPQERPATTAPATPQPSATTPTPAPIPARPPVPTPDPSGSQTPAPTPSQSGEPTPSTPSPAG